MTADEKAQATARERGHDIEPDPPFMSAANRWTCKTCGRAVIANGPAIYGTATTEQCDAAAPDPLSQRMIEAINTNPITRRAFKRLAEAYETGAIQ